MKVCDTVLVSNPEGSLAEVWAGCVGTVEVICREPVYYTIKVKFPIAKVHGGDYGYFAESELSLVTEYATFTGATDPPMDAARLEGVMKEEDDRLLLTVEGLMRLYPETAGGFIRSLIDQGRHLQHREDVKWLEAKMQAAVTSLHNQPRCYHPITLEDWQTFKQLPIN